MKVLDVQDRWIHTHFILDRGDIAPAERSLIDEVVRPVLRENHIQVGFHFREEPNRGYTRFVLECVPLEHVRDELRRVIAATVSEFPGGGRRNTVTGVRVEEEPHA